MECPYCGRKMKISNGDLPSPLQFPSCKGGFFHRPEVILWCGDKFLTGSRKISRELAGRGYNVRKVGDEYDIIPRRR